MRMIFINLTVAKISKNTTFSQKVFHQHTTENLNRDLFVKLKKFREVAECRNKTGTSKVGAISKAQKAQNIFFGKNLKFSKKVAQCRKM